MHNMLWEYHHRSARNPDVLVSSLNTLGAQGWELVSVVAEFGTTEVHAFFKRPKDFKDRHQPRPVDLSRV